MGSNDDGVLNTECLTDSHAQVSAWSVLLGSISRLGDGSLAWIRYAFIPICVRTGAAQRDAPGIQTIILRFLYGACCGRDGCMNWSMRLLRLRGVQRHFLIVGPLETEDDPVRDETLRVIKEHPRIYSVAYSPTPERVMAASDVLVLPSYREGFPTVVLEAAAVGLPSIVARFGGADEVVVDGVTGRVVEKQCVPPLHDAMKVAILDPECREKWRTEALSRVRDKFSQERMVGLYLSFYRNRRGIQ